MLDDDRLDTASLFGSPVVDDTGRTLGRVIAIVHRADGCDVLVERRRWLRYTALRFDLADLVARDGAIYLHRPAQRRSTGGPGDDRVA